MLYLPCSVLVEGDEEVCPNLSVEVQADKPFNRTFSVARCTLNCPEPCLTNVTMSLIEGFRVSYVHCYSFGVSRATVFNPIYLYQLLYCMYVAYEHVTFNVVARVQILTAE